MSYFALFLTLYTLLHVLQVACARAQPRDVAALIFALSVTGHGGGEPLAVECLMHAHRYMDEYSAAELCEVGMGGVELGWRPPATKVYTMGMGGMCETSKGKGDETR